MATEIYLGYPSENIKKWIEKNYKPAFKLTDPLCFTAEEPNATLNLYKSDWAEYDNQVVFSYDKQNWSNYEFRTEITLTNIGDKVYFRAADDVNNRLFNGYAFDINNGKIAASGNLNTLLKADGSVLDLSRRINCYNSMFSGCDKLTQAPELPATTLGEACYYFMFCHCPALAQAPKLPATTLVTACYDNMFWFCKSPFTFPDKTFDEVANLIQNEYLIGDYWHCYDEEGNEIVINPIEIICSDKTMIATFNMDESTWTLAEK